MFDMMAMAGAAAPVAEMADADGSASVSPVTSEVRKYFPETWIWDCFDSGFVPSLCCICRVVVCVTNCFLTISNCIQF